MNKIDEMIRELCPEGVKRVKLGKVCEILNGYAFKSTKYDSKGIRVIRISDVKSGYIDNCDIKYYPLSEIDAFTNYILCENDIVMSLTGNCGRVAIISKNIMPCALNQRVAALRSKEQLIQNYLFYLLNSPIFEAKAMENANGAGQKNLSTTWLANIEIPLPPLAIQQEIVSILDSFSSLQSKLEEELAVRQKQMEFYREKLLTFDENDSSVKWMKLGEVGTMTKGVGILKSDFVESGFPCIHYGQVHTFYNTSTSTTKSFISLEYAKKVRKAKKGDLIIATTSEDVEACCKAVVWLGDGEVAFSGDSHCFSHNQNPKYMSYLFQTEQFAKQKRMSSSGAKVVRVSGESMLKFEFPFPPLSRQQEIVSVLDTMSSLIDKLRLEIEQRRKQYEYYREKLLSFD